jgi:phosphopantothenoylcysteine decarboxylase/phosphopantothenate--cysteine ligase
MRILLTAGPTREPIDAVRFISNRSSGKLGLAVAAAAVDAGHDVTLLLGPGPAPAPAPGSEWNPASPCCCTYRFESSAELQQLLDAHFKDCDLLIMAAAVADYRPATVAEGKLPRHPDKPLVLELQPVPDLVALAAKGKRSDQRIVAFALEEAATLEARATEKMRRKGVDAILANPLGTMESDAITATLLWATGEKLTPGRMSKPAFAAWLIKQVTHHARN